MSMPIQVAIVNDTSSIEDTITSEYFKPLLDNALKNTSQGFRAFNEFLLSKRFGLGKLDTPKQIFLKRLLNKCNVVDIVEQEMTNLTIIKEFETLKGNDLIDLNKMFCFDKSTLSFYSCLTGLPGTFIAFEIEKILQIAFGCLHFLLLIFTFNTKSIKCRLLVPYLVPLCLMVASVFLGLFMQSVSSTLRSIVSIGLTAFIVGIYGSTLVRFYYLRYLYGFLSKATDKKVKVHRILSSAWFGVFSTFVCAFVYTLFWLAIAVPYSVVNVYEDNVLFGVNVIYLMQSLIGCILGIVFMSVDIVINRKLIKEKGILHFFTFEDPYFLRLDLFCFVTVFISLILLIIFNLIGQEWADYCLGIASFISIIGIYFLGGFTAILVECWKFIKRKATTDAEESSEITTEFEHNFKDQKFVQLFKTFCEKEFSLENFLLYEHIIKLRGRSKSSGSTISTLDFYISNEEFEEVWNLFFKPLAKYEVNFPSRVKKQIDAVHNSGDGISLETLESIICTELLLNLKDTYSRLVATREFSRWQLVHTIQSEQNIK